MQREPQGTGREIAASASGREQGREGAERGEGLQAEGRLAVSETFMGVTDRFLKRMFCFDETFLQTQSQEA